MTCSHDRPRGHATTLAAISERIGASAAATAATAANGSAATQTAATIVTSVSSSTRTVTPGALFVALPGRRTHGATFAAAARDAGAVAILTDPAGAVLAADAGPPVLVHPNVRDVLGTVAALVYGTTPQHPKLIGVTGTNGKTTTTYLLTALLDGLDVPTGMSSTVERRICERRLPTAATGRLTTPEADDLHALVAGMRAAGVEAAAIEVSAQAITRQRIVGLPFDVALFTNLAHDHLDDYGTMHEYYLAKRALFTPAHTRRAVTLVDDEWGQRLAAEAEVPVTTLASCHAPEDARARADWTVAAVVRGLERTEFTLRSRDGHELTTWVNQPGEFIAIDAAAALVALLEAGYDFNRVAARYTRERGIEVVLPGRLDVVNPGERGPRVYVDYGHTPASFTAVLQTLRPLTTGRLFMVFGADGDRDTTKRPDMARAAALADVVVVTDYNPRFEDPAAIRATLVNTLHTEFPDREVYEFPEPAAGIAKAISLAAEGDIVFVGGHGHRSDMEVRGVLQPFFVKDAVRAALTAAGWGA